MVFLGDLACPAERVDSFNDAIKDISIFKDEVVVVNLEAVILNNGDNKQSKLYNSPKVLDSLLKNARKVIVSLANNHMYDYPDEILKTKSFLENRGVGVFGLYDEDGSVKPYEYEDAKGQFALFGHCWDLYTRTNPNRENNVRVVDTDYADFISIVSNYIKTNPLRKVICFMHWNYDLEEYPFPMHRKLAHDLIDSGCYGVIGSHSHVSQCVELYNNRPIAYCLGNFYLPSGIFFDGKLKYPTKSNFSLGIRVTDSPSVLKFESDSMSALKYIGSVNFEQTDNLNGMSDKDYLSLFKNNRIKKSLVPIFIDYKGGGYRFKRALAISRVKIIKYIKKLIQAS